MKLSDRAGGGLSRQAYREIRQQILSGKFRPGEMILAKTLAEKLKVSRTPVHDALKLLCQEGLVQVIPRVGYVISEVTLADVQQIFELRLLLELHAATRAVERATDAGIAALRSIEDRQEKLHDSYPAGDPRFARKLVDLNREYHLALAALGGNDRLVENLGHLLDEGQRIHTLDPMRSEHSFMPPGDHRRVTDALERRDALAVREALVADINVAQERITRAITAPVPVG